MRQAAILLACILPFGCAPPQHWLKANDTSQDAVALSKALIDCDEQAAEKGRTLDTMFGSESAYATLQKCMHDKGYTQS